MSDASFTPYWKPLKSGSGPNSWVSFAVTQIAGLHRPVVVSSLGGYEEESMHAPPLVACCRRIATVFSDPANHLTARAELGLAAAYYAEHGNDAAGGTASRRSSCPNCRGGTLPTPTAGDRGTARGRNAPNHPEPLGTVYRDTAIEWGMAIVDITDPDTVRYGIFGFIVGMAKFVSSADEARPRFQGASFAFEEGPLRVLEEVRTRKAMSAADYTTKFKYADLVYDASQHDYDMQRLVSIPLVDDTALSLVWPPGEEDSYVNPVPVNTHGSGTSGQSIKETIQRAFSPSDLDISVFDEVRNLTGFKSGLRQYLLQNPKDVLSAAEVSPILCENLSLPHFMPNEAICAPRARDLVFEGWTVIVLRE